MIVRDLLGLNKEFRNFKIIAGKGGEDKRIRNINVMEVPDGVYWVEAGDFIITTAYCIKKGDISLEYLLRVMIDRDAAALGIKIGRFIDEIPKEILRIADEHNLPIIYIPLTTGYSDILIPVFNTLKGKDNYDYHIIENYKKELRLLHKKEYSIKSLTKLISSYIGYDIHLYLNQDNCLRDMGEAEGSNDKEIIKENLDKIYAADDYVILEDKNNKYVVFKIKSVKSVIGFIYVTLDLDQTLTKIDMDIIVETIPIISIYLLSYPEKIKLNDRDIDNFYTDLLEGRYIDSNFDLIDKASYFELSIEASRIVWIIDFSMVKQSDSKDIKKYILFILGNNKNITYFKETAGRIIFIIELKESVAGIKETSSFFNKILLELEKKYESKDFYIGISKFCENLKYLTYAYDEADFSIKIGKQLYENLDEKGIFYYDDYIIYHLLCEVGDHPALSKLYRNTIKKLVKYDFENQTELLNTLNVFMDKDFNINDAASALFIHRNTLYKRIKRINKILDLDISKSENRLIIQLVRKWMELMVEKDELG